MTVIMVTCFRGAVSELRLRFEEFHYGKWLLSVVKVSVFFEPGKSRDSFKDKMTMTKII